MAQAKLSMRTARYWLEFPIDFDIDKDKYIKYSYTWSQVETGRLFFDAVVDVEVKLERVAQEIIFQLWQERWSGGDFNCLLLFASRGPKNTACRARINYLQYIAFTVFSINHVILKIHGSSKQAGP